MLNHTDLARVDLNLLVCFQIVLEERHVGRAAARLNLTPSAISHGLSRLRALFADPLFLRTPKGVVPSARANELSAPIADILSRVSRVVASTTPFDPATSNRRFTIGAPDAVSVVLLPALLAELQRNAPRIDVCIRHVFPQYALDELEARAVDLAITPLEGVPVRFAARLIGEDDFVVAARKGHPFFRAPTLDSYCEQQHVLVSVTGEPKGFVDLALESKRRVRRVAVVVPHFMLALAALSETDLVAALPRSLVKAQGARFGLASVDVPLALPTFGLRAVVPQAALMDAGLTWLVDRVELAGKVMRAGRPKQGASGAPARARRRG